MASALPRRELQGVTRVPFGRRPGREDSLGLVDADLLQAVSFSDDFEFDAWMVSTHPDAELTRFDVNAHDRTFRRAGECEACHARTGDHACSIDAWSGDVECALSAVGGERRGVAEERAGRVLRGPFVLNGEDVAESLASLPGKGRELESRDEAAFPGGWCAVEDLDHGQDR